MAMAKRLDDYEKLRNSLYALQMRADIYGESVYTLIRQIDEVRRSMGALFEDGGRLSKLQEDIHDLHPQAESVIAETRAVAKNTLDELDKLDALNTAVVYAPPKFLKQYDDSGIV